LNPNPKDQPITALVLTTDALDALSRLVRSQFLFRPTFSTMECRRNQEDDALQLHWAPGASGAPGVLYLIVDQKERHNVGLLRDNQYQLEPGRTLLEGRKYWLVPTLSA
jgi:hypothetical protein